MPNLKMAKTAPLASTSLVGRRILFIRGEKVMVDADLAVDQLERKVAGHDKALAGVIDAIRQLMREPEPREQQIGFTADLGKKRKS